MIRLCGSRVLGCLDDWNALYLFAGPRVILRCYEEICLDPLFAGGYLLDDGPYAGFLFKPLKEILQTRDVDIVETILDHVNGKNDRCTNAITRIRMRVTSDRSLL